jgi:hypothetical protein
MHIASDSGRTTSVYSGGCKLVMYHTHLTCVITDLDEVSSFYEAPYVSSLCVCVCVCVCVCPLPDQDRDFSIVDNKEHIYLGWDMVAILVNIIRHSGCNF